ncbi:MbnH family di-heme enzyme [Paraglaciecola sp.]|uniref:MbnH family di-heme enzyme n=1 Tax=Paraglaciecola sp. TaxID=1920173 RepID=UPI003EF9ED89
MKPYLVGLLLSCLLLACNKPPIQYKWNIPQGFPPPNVPLDNPMTAEKVALGEQLFFDLNLSANQTQACASCHIPKHGFAEPLRTSIGSTGEITKRNALALINVGYNGSLNWAHNGLNSLEEQIRIPLFSESPVEMGVTGNEQKIIARLDKYKPQFDNVFGTKEINFDVIIKALASYVRSLNFFNSAFDRYAYQLDEQAMTEQQLQGLELFFSEKLECFHCHGGFNFSQSSQHALQTLDLKPFHNTGLYNLDDKGSYANDDQGLADITFKPSDIGKFRAPTLRNIALTAPYMHDGSIMTLSEVIDFYAAGGRGAGKHNPNKSVFINGFNITDDEKSALLAFLQSLTDQTFIQDSSL